MRRIKVTVAPALDGAVYRVVSASALAEQWTPELQFLVNVVDAGVEAQVAAWRSRGLCNIAGVRGIDLEEGDVVAYDSLAGKLTVLHREGDDHHSLFLTNRCNSYCLMCSQPPTHQVDDWLIEQAIDVVHHVRTAPAVVGISGGEPLLAASGLCRLLAVIDTLWPSCAVEILTNGRLLHDPEVVNRLFAVTRTNLRWLVPLYGHADFLHDFVVQSPGAFDETLSGLLTLQSFGQPIQLRIVLIRPVLEILDELCRFIGQNLPFVECVALMACEPTGFALANRDLCELDLFDSGAVLERASLLLERYRVPHLFMNAPLCALPRALWPRARRSISDWKNVYADACGTCTVREQCCGLFAWHEQQWKPTQLKPVKELLI